MFALSFPRTCICELRLDQAKAPGEPALTKNLLPSMTMHDKLENCEL